MRGTDEGYIMLSDKSSPREVVSKLSKILIIALVCLLLALIEQVVGYATNYWMVKGFGSSVYHLEGLWNECFCSASCYCNARDASGDNRIRVACVFETLGLAGLVAVLTLTLLGAFKKNYKLVIKVTSAVAGFVTGALILAGVVGIGATAANDPYINLHFSFALCTKAGAMAILAAFLLIVDIRPRFRAREYREYTEEKKDTENKKQKHQKSDQRPTTLGEYLNQRNAESSDDNRQNKEADYVARRKKKDRQMKQYRETEEYANKGCEGDGYSDDDKDAGFEQRKKKEETFQTKRNREDKYEHRKHSADLYDDGYVHKRKYSNEANQIPTDENQFNEDMQYAQINSFRNDYEDKEQYPSRYEDLNNSYPKSAEDINTRNVDPYNETQEHSKLPETVTSSRQLPASPYKDQHKYPTPVPRKYQTQVPKAADERDFNRIADTGYKMPQLNRSPNASESRLQHDWDSRYNYDNQNYGYYGNQSVQVEHNQMRRGQVDHNPSQPSAPRNYFGTNTYGLSETEGRNINLSPSYQPQGTSHGARSKQSRSNETEV